MKIDIIGNGLAVFECHDKLFRDSVQDLVDGSKTRLQPEITFHHKSIPKLYNAIIRHPKYNIAHVNFTDRAKNDMMNTVANIRKRKVSIQNIRFDYSSEKELDMRGYKVNGEYKPMRHQISMFQIINDNESAALIADPGTCKTAPYLWAIDHRIKQGIIKKALVITLGDLKKNVLAEMAIQTPDLKGVMLSNKKQSDNILNKTYKVSNKNMDYDIYISNYESMFSLVDLFDEGYFQMIIADEVHRIGSPRSRQTKSIINKLDMIKYKYPITGTLHANNYTSFFMPLRFMGPDTVPQANFYEFRRVHFFTVDPDGYIWKPQKGLGEIIKKLIANVSICFKKEECLDLPPKIYQRYSCKLSSEQSRYYKSIKDDLVLTIEDMCNKCDKKDNCEKMCDDEIMIKNILVVMMKLSQITCGFYINRVISIDKDTNKEIVKTNTIILKENPKLDLLMTVLNNIPTDRKVIIWASFIYGIKLISERISKCYGPDSFITVSGNDDTYDKVQEFKNNPNKRWFIANQKKAGVGQNIQFSCYQFFFNNGYSFVNRDQAEGRQDREGQKDCVTIGDVYCEDTIDEKALEILDNKKDLDRNLNSLANATGIKSELRKKSAHFKKILKG